MITEIILVIFAIAYYLFSVFLVATLIQDVNNHNIWYMIKCLIITIIISPVATPIILGIEIGQAITDNQ